MMNQKTLIGLAVVAVVAVGAALALNHSRQPASNTGAQAGLLAPGLAEELDKIKTVELLTANNAAAVTLEQKDGRWGVAQRGGYPADVGKLRAWLLKVADARLLEQKTSDPARYADLGVSDIKEPEAKGIEVHITGPAKPVDFIVGLPSAHGGDTFARRSAEAQSWLAKGSLLPDKQASDWLQKDLANISSDRIASVTITHADGQRLHLGKAKAGDSQFTISDIPKGREASSEFVANGLASVLSELRLDDVASSSEIPAPADATLARYQTFDGLVVEARQWKVADKAYVAFSASLDETVATAHAKAAAEKESAEVGTTDAEKGPEVTSADTEDKPASTESDSNPPAKTPEQAVAGLKAEVDALNATFAGWSFVLPAYKIGNIDKRMEDLLKPKADSKPATK